MTSPYRANALAPAPADPEPERCSPVCRDGAHRYILGHFLGDYEKVRCWRCALWWAWWKRQPGSLFRPEDPARHFRGDRNTLARATAPLCAGTRWRRFLARWFAYRWTPRVAEVTCHAPLDRLDVLHDHPPPPGKKRCAACTAELKRRLERAGLPFRPPFDQLGLGVDPSAMDGFMVKVPKKARRDD